jgi:hypothetical protein
VLVPGGEVRLIIPDKRFTFDYLRAESRMADVLYAYLNRARVPQPIAMLDFGLNAAHVDCQEAWAGVLDPKSLKHHFDFPNTLGLARDIMTNGNYHDIHCWAFTPESFARIMRESVSHDLISFECVRFHDTARNDMEFFVAMRATDDKQAALASWERAASCTSSAVPGTPLWKLRRAYERFTKPTGFPAVK